MKKTIYLLALVFTTIGFSQDILMQNGTFTRCAPDKFFDSGGEFGNYGLNENLVTTICPQNSDEFLILDFLNFVTQQGLNLDEMNIYDGDDVSAPLLGNYSGPVGPFTVSASDTNTSGCLTIEFISNDSGSLGGWEADILCAVACQDIVASIDDTLPAPNGSGVVGILPGDTVDFTGSATFSDNGSNATYTWNFGDGSPETTGINVSNTYANPGTYTVTFTVTDDNPQGCSNVETITVFVLGPNVVVDQDTFTSEELIQDVLVNSPCASVSAIVSSTGSDFSSSEPNGIGYFFSNGTDFPFEDGILLTSGDASRAGGPNEFLGDGSDAWPGDIELDAVTGIDSNNASFIQFDFVPLADSISFEFLMASEEYDMGSFECTFSDAFAFLLTDSAGNTTNLAVLPGTNTPILVTNIHPDNGATCGGINEQYFGEYTPNNGPPISFDGRTAVFTAQSAVVPGEAYTIKLVVADDGDNNYDSGVFLKAGSFDLGGDLGDDITIANGNAECGGEEIILDTGLTNATHVWFKDGVEIDNETESTLTVTEDGVYSVDFNFAGVCQGSADPIEIEFRLNPTFNSAQNLFSCDSGDGSAEFDLSQNDDDILGAQSETDFIVSYHLTEQEAIDNTGVLPNMYTNVTNPQTIWARIADNTQQCYETVSFFISASSQPNVNAVSNLELCDDVSNDGFEEFDLASQSLGILGTQSDTDFEVTYHLNFADANGDTGALPLNYTNTVNPQPIFVRVESTSDANCYTASSSAVFNLIVDPRDDASFSFTPTCDGGTATVSGTLGGTFGFDVPPSDSAVIDPVTGEVSNGSPGTTYSVTYTTTGACPATDTATFSSLPIDDASFDVSPTCDGGTVSITGTTGGTFSFNPAPTDTAVIDPNTGDVANGTPGETYGIEYTTAGTCPSTSVVEFAANPLPSLVAPSPLEVCDDGTPDGLTEIDLTIKNTEISANNPAYAVSYHLTPADAESGTDPLAIPYTNVTNPQTVFVRVEDVNTGCYDTTTMDLVVEQAPVAFTPEPLRYCDPDNDGLGIFTLTDAENEITAGAGGLDVTYHETMANADNGVDAIDTSVNYSNIVTNTQTIYVRVESNTIATDCATIVELELIVEPTPQLIAPTPLEVCDDTAADGFAQFDLTTKEDEILNGQDPTQYVVSYYETQAFADAPSNAIANPTAYTNTDDFNQVIWVRVDDNTTVAGCYKITTLELIVNPLPVLVTPPPLELCDVNNPGDEVEAFTLEDANDAILNGQTGITLSYYETQMDADNGTDPITGPYTNTTNAQTVYVRAVNDATGCVSTVTVTLRVDPVPSPEDEPTEIRVCDDDNDGFAEFDLETRTVEITNGEPDVEITYHETESDADTGENPLASPYTNIVANSQMIYVRSENTLTGCYSLTDSELQLIVDPSPEVPTAIDDYVVCDTDSNGFAQFDLTTKDEEIYNGQNPVEFTLTYHLNATDAATGNNPIVNTGNYTNATNPQVIHVRMESSANGCVDTGEFEIRVELPPEAVQPTPLEECDDLGERPGDEVTVFDLTVKDDEITGGNASWSVAYYETSADAQAEENAIPDPTQYTNMMVGGLPSNPQTLYVVVTDTDTGCVDFTTMTIRVLPNPTPTESDDIPDLELCDDINTGDGVEEFNLLGLEGTNAQEDLILNGEQGVTATYYETQEDADAGTNAIADPAQYTNIDTPTQEIYVRVTNDITGCYELVDFTIRVNPLPEVVAVTDFIQCEVNTDGTDSFDLTTKDGEVLNGQNPMQFTVTYHDNLADAEAQMNALVSSYTNTSNPQQIFVAITNNETGCSIATQSFNIEVQEGAEANSDSDPITYEQCDDNMETDGDPSNDSVQFDLSTQDAEILDGQDGSDYTVSYYGTEADANLGVNPLPTLYENTTNPQVIYARVDNDTQVLLPIALDLAALGNALDLDGNGTPDTYDTDNDGVFDLVDVDGDGTSDVVGANADGTIAFVDVDGDGQGDPVDLDNDGTFDNQQDSSVCFAVAGLTLQVNPLPLFDLDDTYTLCLGTNGTEVLDPLVIDTGLSGADYGFEWSYEGAVLAGETGPALMPTEGGTYQVVVTDLVTGCVNDLDVGITQVGESGPPSLTVDVLTQAFADSHVIEAMATGQGVYEYSLDGGPWQDGGLFSNVSPGEHEVTARDRNGCGLVTQTVYVFDYPLYFTPNGDGRNDTWQIDNIGNSAKIYIFDRYGKLLKQISPSGDGWDGTYNGSAMPTSDYWFTVEYDEPGTDQRKQYRAHFTLKR